jgi:hypothetical protein
LTSSSPPTKVFIVEFSLFTAAQIQDKSPPTQCNISYVKIGCYVDANIENSSFPSMILKPVLPLLSEGKTWSLRGESWDKFLEDFVCSCAQKAKQFEYNYFGVKRFGKFLVHSKHNNQPGKCVDSKPQLKVCFIYYFTLLMFTILVK